MDYVLDDRKDEGLKLLEGGNEAIHAVSRQYLFLEILSRQC